MDYSEICFLLCAIRFVTASSVTYPGIGTFYSTDFFHPIYRPSTLFFLPHSPQEIEPTFELYTRANPLLMEQFRWNNSQEVLNSRYFNPSKSTKFIIYGFGENHFVFAARWTRKMKNYLLDYADVNVFIVDWSKSNFLSYEQATVNTRVVGAMLAIQIECLCQGWTKCTGKQFHIIGGSLSAQAASYAGKFLNGINQTLKQITGLDPAGPFFQGLGPEAHLWYTDAHFVDVIHTDRRFLIGLGNTDAVGHVDFYMNGGSAQPGCHEERFTTFYLKGYIHGLTSMFVCDHMRANELYIEAIARSRHNGTPPIGYACDNFDDYNQGKCESPEYCKLITSKSSEKTNQSSVSDGTLRKQRQNCAMFGPRVVEYSDNFGQNETENHGKLFFINTAEHEPYFR